MRNTHLVVLLFPLAACSSLFSPAEGEWTAGDGVADTASSVGSAIGSGASAAASFVGGLVSGW